MSDRCPIRHILSLSGGKDSTALAVYMRDRVPEMEYVFMDTGEELPETYEYIEKLEAYLGRPIVRLNPERSFAHWLHVYRGVLPSPMLRWCTRKLKIEPFEHYVGNDVCYNYVGIRADEAQRKGYISSKPNIIARYPFIEEGITKDDVLRILDESGLGLPDYYRWRTRSGCYFCFFQQKIEWVGLLENHPQLFERAAQYEKIDPVTGKRYTWVQGESLRELSQPERVAKVRMGAERRLKAFSSRLGNQSLLQVFSDVDSDEDEQQCLICSL